MIKERILVRNIKDVIIDVTAKGIVYVDSDKHESMINFEECHHNYLNSVDNNPQQVKIAENWKRVGQRNIDAQPPYIELFTTHIIRFEFENIEHFHELRHRIRKSGWQTIDLT